MKVFAVLLLAVAATNAVAVLPVDSTVVKSERTGGNFAYSVESSRGYVAPVAYAAAPVAYAASPVAYTAGFVKPAEVKNVEYKPVQYAAQYKPVAYAAQPVQYAAQPVQYAAQPVVYSADYVKPVEYKPVVAYSTPVVKTEVKPVQDAAVKPVKYEQVAVGYYGAPVATAYPYNAYPYAYNYPYNYNFNNYFPYATYPYGVVKADK